MCSREGPRLVWLLCGDACARLMLGMPMAGLAVWVVSKGELKRHAVVQLESLGAAVGIEGRSFVSRPLPLALALPPARPQRRLMYGWEVGDSCWEVKRFVENSEFSWEVGG